MEQLKNGFKQLFLIKKDGILKKMDLGAIRIIVWAEKLC